MKTLTLEKQLIACRREWAELFKALKRDISDDCRCTNDPEDEMPGMLVTIGFTPATEPRGHSWDYQTGDNSYSGGAYGHPHWAVAYLYLRSNSTALANDCVEQIFSLIEW